jgi:UDP-GlcNAc:undecaprenyl-phosphate GlcNAc-1-phosphate transferase
MRSPDRPALHGSTAIGDRSRAQDRRSERRNDRRSPVDTRN